MAEIMNFFLREDILPSASSSYLSSSLNVSVSRTLKSNFSIAAFMSETFVITGSNVTEVLLVAILTDTSLTPSSFPTTFSTDFAHEAHVIPDIESVT